MSVRLQIIQMLFYQQFINYFQQMLLGVAVVIMICVLIILFLLFYLVTRYFNYRLQKSLQSRAEVYSMVDEIQATPDQLFEGQQVQYAQKLLQQRNKKEQERKKAYLNIIQVSQLKQSLSESDFNIYGKSKLQAKLQMQPIIFKPELLKSKSLQKIKIQDKLQQQIQPSMRQQRELSRRTTDKTFVLDDTKKSTTHKFISKMVAYTDEGISVFENFVDKIYKVKQKGQMLEKRKINKYFIGKNDNNFQDALQAYGFQTDIKGAFKFQISITIPNLKIDTFYAIQQFKQQQTKQEIQIAQFFKNVYQLSNLLIQFQV